MGTGLIARLKHLPALQRLDTAELCAICDISRDAAQEAADKFGIKGVYNDLDRMLSAEKPDIVDVCTPPKTHLSVAKAALEAGAHLLVEKPMCATVDECDELIRIAKAKNLKICVAHSDLFYPSFTKARAALAQGKIGTFRGMNIHLSTPVDYITSKRDHWANKLPGGVFGESGPHVVYMTLAFINPIKEVSVTATKILPEYAWSPFEDYRVTMVGDAGICSASMIYTTKQWAAGLEIWGTDGTLRVDLESQTLTRVRREALNVLRVGASAVSEAAQILVSGISTGIDRLAQRYTQTHQELLKAYIAAILENKPSPVGPEEGRESIRVMNMIVDAIHRSAK